MTDDHVSLMLKGCLFGFSAGISPGPLTVLVIHSTLRSGIGAGVRIAIAPAMTDIPILAGAIVLNQATADSAIFITLVSFIGAGFLFKLGISSWNEKLQIDRESLERKPQKGVLDGIIANFLNPHPYLFWMTVGAPLILRQSSHPIAGAALFMSSFLVVMISMKLMLAGIASRFRPLLNGNGYRVLARGSSIALVGFAIHFMMTGLTQIGLTK